MALRFYNTLTRELQVFEPLEAGHVRLYACGPTVYQPPHIGNYRAFLFNDLLHRYLEWKGYSVKFVLNLTDVDDRTIEGALDADVRLDEYTAPLIRGFFDDLEALGVRPADAYPRATHHIDEMVALIDRLVARGHAYRADGSLYFDVSSLADYGKLSRVDLEAATHSRVASDELGKKDVRDFAVWKATRDADRRVGAVWMSPWGEGRPGWHLECSAMSMAELGETFDIHTGGEDLVFPHHEDEIAQSEGATGRPFVRYWLHVKHLLVNGEKMSKSLGNDYKLHDLRERGHSTAAIRYLLLSAHYRRELNFTFDGLGDAQHALDRLLAFQDRLERTRTDDAAPPTPLPDHARTALAELAAGLDDDLNVPAALAALFTFVRDANAALDRQTSMRPGDIEPARDALRQFDQVLGLLELARTTAGQLDPAFVAWVEGRLADRKAARGRRDFAAADAIRAELAQAGVAVEDSAEGTRWKATRS